MDEWAYLLAKELKKRDNPSVTGPCVGQTVSTSPFQVVTLNGSIILDQDNAYVCRHLRERKSKYKTTAKHSQSGTLNGGPYTATGDMEEQGDIELDTVWKVGDLVLVVPSGDGQRFFIVDVLEG